MKSKILSLFLLSVILLSVGMVSAVTLAEWDLTTDGVPTNVDTNLNAGNFMGGLGIGTINFGVNGAYANSWTNTTTKDSTDYYQITLFPKSGYDLSISKINFGDKRSTTGPITYQLQWSKNSDFSLATTIGTYTSLDGTETIRNLLSSIVVNNGETIYIRWFAYNSNNSAGTFYITNDTLTIEGTLTEIVEPEEITECAITGNLGNNLNIRIRDINVEEGFGEDDEEWYPLDEIEVEVEVENKGPEDIDDIVLAWGLYNVDLDDWVIDDEENDFNLKDGDEETIIINFKLDDPDEFEDDAEYIFYVWAIGEDDEFDKNETCVIESESIEIAMEDDFVILDDIEFPEVVQCGAEVQITADVWNIGEDDQDEVYVMIHNSELGISEKIEIGDINSFDEETLNTIIKLPKNVEEKAYYLKFFVYDEDNDIYENGNDDEAEFTIYLKVEGSCVTGPTVLVSANLESGGKAGQELVVRATITNIGDELETYNLNIVGYSDWASSFESEMNMVILGAGESQDVLLTFKVKEDVSGDKFFNIEVLSGDELIVEQPVSVSIESGFGFPGITGKVISRSNWYLWGIGALNIILVIVIIFVAVRAIRK